MYRFGVHKNQVMMHSLLYRAPDYNTVYEIGLSAIRSLGPGLASTESYSSSYARGAHFKSGAVITFFGRPFYFINAAAGTIV